MLIVSLDPFTDEKTGLEMLGNLIKVTLLVNNRTEISIQIYLYIVLHKPKSHLLFVMESQKHRLFKVA